MDNTFGNKNHFEDGTVFESGAKLGNLNTVGKDVVFHHDAVLGVGNDISEHAKFGQVFLCVCVCMLFHSRAVAYLLAQAALLELSHRHLINLYPYV